MTEAFVHIEFPPLAYVSSDSPVLQSHDRLPEHTVEGLSQELVAIIAAAIAVAAIMVPGVRALRREIGELRQQIVAVDQRLSDEIGALRSEFRSDLGVFRDEMRADFNSFRQEMRGEFSSFREEMRGELSSFQEEIRGEFGGLRADVGEVRNQVNELRERMARVEGLFEGFTRSEPALGTGSA